MWQVEVQLHTLTPALHRCKGSASRPGRFTPGERVNGMQLIRGWVETQGLNRSFRKSPLNVLDNEQRFLT